MLGQDAALGCAQVKGCFLLPPSLFFMQPKSRLVQQTGRARLDSSGSKKMIKVSWGNGVQVPEVSEHRVAKATKAGSGLKQLQLPRGWQAASELCSSGTACCPTRQGAGWPKGQRWEGGRSSPLPY